MYNGNLFDNLAKDTIKMIGQLKNEKEGVLVLWNVWYI